MANISTTLEQDLKDAGYRSVIFYDKHYETTTIMTDVVEIVIFSDFDTNTSLGVFGMKTIKLPKKKLVDISYCLGKLNADSVYNNFVEEFETILEDNGIKNSINVYPTSYGIGIFVLFNFRNETTDLKTQISGILIDLGIDFKTEHSDAGWVFRYKISKSKENIEKLKLV